MVSIRMTLEMGRIVRVSGPLKVKVSNGQVLVLGAIFKSGDSFSVSSYRSYGIKALDDSVLEVELSVGATLEYPRPGEEVVDKWVFEADDVLRRGCRTVMVLGPTDVGKSSFTALTVNRALLYGYRVGVIDADVGQADVGPPATVSATVVEKPILWLRELKAKYLRFVGSITPQRSETRIVASVADLAAKLRLLDNVDVIVIDTDGWVQGVSSVEYKAEAARYAGVDAVVVVGDQKLYGMIQNIFAGLRCGARFVPSPQVKRERDRTDRRQLRREAYRRYLEGSVERRIRMGSVSIIGSCFFSGERLPAEATVKIAKDLRVPVIAASETYDTIYVVVDRQPHVNLQELSERYGKQIYVLDVNMTRNALVSVIGDDGEEKAVGILKDVNFAKGELVVLTPYRGSIRGIVLGHIRLSQELEEVGRPLRCVI